MIIDTKYKILDDKHVIRSDVSQVLDYCLVYKIKTGLLLYPKLTEIIDDSYQIKNTGIQIKVETINISSKDKEEFLHNLNSFKEYLLMKFINQEQDTTGVK